MINQDKQVKPALISERKFVELPLLDQLKDLGWTIIDLEMKQKPQESHREHFTEVIMEPILRDSLKEINPWLEDDQVDELVRRITALSHNTLLENNQYVLDLFLENTSVDQNRKTGERSPTVRYIDFETLDNNSFIAVCQFKVRILGTEHHIIPDVVLFINGLPVVVIECKSPKAKDAIPEAIDQMLRYSEQRGAKKEGNKGLFYYNQFTVATCRNEAKFGTISSRHEKHYFRWSDPYPLTLDDIKTGSSAPNDQQRLVAGMLSPVNLLSLICTYSLFVENDKGKKIKIVGRYQQFRAVKLTVKRLLDGRNKVERSGIIWHTQGAGKSLTMVFLVRELYLHDQLRQWKVVFITDRTQLEEQLHKTTRGIGKTVKVADNIRKLKKLLPTSSSDLIMAMIHKFQERDLTTTFPELNPSPNILVLTDEAHRSQYALLGANLDRALPNATEIAFTGTPTDKTEKKYKDYIDKYTMRQSVEDGVTLEIVYEGRTHNAEVTDQQAMDVEFEDVFSEYNIHERLQILGYGSRDAYLEAKETIQAKARDMVRHYVEQVFPNGFKAQVVATSREAAARYKTALDEAIEEQVNTLEQHNPMCIDLDRLKTLKTAVIISGGGHNDKPHLKAHAKDEDHKRHITSFKLPFGGQSEEGISGDVGILVVNNMLLTGFDAPIEQVMYLDRIIRAHNLLQAVARVNRVGDEAKEKGFIVDYVGIGHHLKEALDNYYEREQKEIIETFGSIEEEIKNLVAAKEALWALLRKYGIEDLNDYDAFFDLFYDEEVRFEYILAFKKFSTCFDLVLPKKEALDHLQEYLQFAEINVMAQKHLRDARLSMKGIPEKLRRITDSHLASRGIDQKVAPISILDEEFLQHVHTRKRTKTKAAEIEHAIRHHLEVNLDEDPELYASFADALEEILRAFKDNWEKIYEELEKLRQKIRNAEHEPTYGLHRKKEMPMFRIFKREIFGDQELSEDDISKLVSLTQNCYETVERELKLTGFWDNIPARNRLKAELQKVLLSPDFNKLPSIIPNRKQIISRIMELAEANNDIILYAA